METIIFVDFHKGRNLRRINESKDFRGFSKAGTLGKSMKNEDFQRLEP